AEAGMAHGDVIGWREQKRRIAVALEDFAASAPVLVGFSLGAAHVKSLLMSRTEVAAGVMVGAGGLEEGRTWPLPNSVEIHHMLGDPFIEAGGPERLVQAVAAAGGDAAHYVYPGEGHLFMDEDGDDFDTHWAAVFHARLDLVLTRFEGGPAAR
ncbi:hypothetical protein, partial [Kribbia dieselivorans]|uniref:hypothetical protein n=1 Tax=Kribbia dieselivorans TaxID=331526 RepID=UPI00083901C2